MSIIICIGGVYVSSEIMERHVRDSSIIIILAFITLTAGIILGSVCLMKTNAGADEGLKTYLDTFLSASQSGVDKFGVFKRAIKENLFYLIIVFAAGFFRIGILFIAAAIIRKGFIMGFTAASFIKFFGIKGILATASMLPGILLIIPAFLTFSAVSADLSLRNGKKQRKTIMFYIILTIIIMAVFCVAALTEGYLTTVFMKWFSPRIMS